MLNRTMGIDTAEAVKESLVVVTVSQSALRVASGVLSPSVRQWRAAMLVMLWGKLACR